MKTFKGKYYVQTPEIENNNCIGCVGDKDTPLCIEISDDNWCTSNGGMIYKEKT